MAESANVSPPRVFVSYTHESDAHRKWVVQFAGDLRRNGVDAMLDIWETRLGSDITLFMERIRDADRVLLICTPTYRKKATTPRGGVGYERLLVTAEVAEQLQTEKIVCVQRVGDRNQCIPTYLSTRLSIDFTEDGLYAAKLDELLRDLHNAREQKPPIGSYPFPALTGGVPASSKRATKGTKAPAKGKLSDRTTPSAGYQPPVGPNPFQEQRSSLGQNIILVGDVVDFTLLPGNTQVNVIRDLWRFLAENEVIRRLRPLRIPRGDGAMVAFRAIDYAEALSFAEEWIKQMSVTATNGFRIAIDTGEWREVEVGAGDDVEKNAYHPIVGTALNECERIVSVAGPGDIVIAEQFVHAWHRQQGIDFAQFVPSDPARPLEVFIKAGVPQQVRFKKRPPAPVPKPIALLDNVSKNLSDIVLPEVEDLLVDVLRQLDPKLSRRRISARVSILVPKPRWPQSPDELWSTDFRYHHEQQAVGRSITTYKFAGVARPEGPLGKAFVSGRCQVLSALPAFADDPNGYVRAMVRANVPEATVRNFGRKARAYLAVPFGLAPDESDGVVCLDTMDPLSSIGARQLMVVANILQDTYGLLIAALWRLRVQS